MMFRQMTGANYVTFYLNDIFITANTGFSSELQSTIVSAVAVSMNTHIVNQSCFLYQISHPS